MSDLVRMALTICLVLFAVTVGAVSLYYLRSMWRAVRSMSGDLFGSAFAVRGKIMRHFDAFEKRLSALQDMLPGAPSPSPPLSGNAEMLDTFLPRAAEPIRVTRGNLAQRAAPAGGEKSKRAKPSLH